MAKFYFTYGIETHPYVGGWTEVEAESRESAIAAFRAYHPDNEAGFINCCSIYTEEHFKCTQMYTNGNFKRFCHERISLKRKVLTDD